MFGFAQAICALISSFPWKILWRLVNKMRKSAQNEDDEVEEPEETNTEKSPSRNFIESFFLVILATILNLLGILLSWVQRQRANITSNVPGNMANFSPLIIVLSMALLSSADSFWQFLLQSMFHFEIIF